MTAALHVNLSAWPGIAVELSDDGRIEASNGRLESLVQSPVVGCRFAELVDGESSGEKWRRMVERKDGGARKWELVLRAGDRLLEPRAFTFLGVDDRAAGWLLEHPDDARAERLSDDLAQINSELIVAQREVLKEQTRLAAALAELQRSNTALDEFAHAVSHDLKAPLRSIIDYAELLVDGSDALAGDRLTYVQRLSVLGKKMRLMIDGMLEYARAGRAASRRETADVGAVLRDVIDFLSPPNDVRVTLAADLPVIDMDRVPFEQVFRNLLSNAIRYRRSGMAHVEVTARDAGDCWELVVADDGPGVPVAQQERIWRMFQTTRPGEGTGIGLAVVKRIVEAQGGRVSVSSAPGEGAQFHVLWPKHPPRSYTEREADGQGR